MKIGIVSDGTYGNRELVRAIGAVSPAVAERVKPFRMKWSRSSTRK